MEKEKQVQHAEHSGMLHLFLPSNIAGSAIKFLNQRSSEANGKLTRLIRAILRERQIQRKPIRHFLDPAPARRYAPTVRLR